MTTPQLHVFPQVSLLDADLRIHVDGLAPQQRVQLSASTCDDRGMLWRSTGHFQADATGRVDLAQHPSLAGSYEGIDPMGLLWSMCPLETDEPFRCETLSPLSITFSLQIKGKTWNQSVQRLKASPDIERQEVKEQGLVGVYFSSKGSSSQPAILILGGAEGTLKEPRGAFLASHGFSVLTLAYFGLEGLPKQLKEIPLECVEKGVAWLRTQPQVDPTRLYLLCSSRGTELGLLSACTLPKKTFQALVAYVPSCAAYGAFPTMQGNAWIYRNQPIVPAAPLSLPIPADPLKTTPYFLLSMQDKRFDGSLIPVEKLDCPLLLISGGKDNVWPSQRFCEKILERLDHYHSPIPRTHLNFPQAGHQISLPSLPTAHTITYHKVLETWVDQGGDPKSQAHASKAAWESTIAFFKSLCGSDPLGPKRAG